MRWSVSLLPTDGSVKRSKLLLFLLCVALSDLFLLLARDLYLDRLHRMDLNNPAIRDRAKQLNWVTIHRVIGDIAVSRSIGDPDYKGFVAGRVVDECLAWPPGHSRCFSGDLLIPDPEFRSKELTRDDEFLILASDGLWDVVTPAEACLQVK